MHFRLMSGCSDLNKRREINMHFNAKNLRGQQYGRLIVLKPTNKRIDNHIVWLCQCNCGRIVKIPSSDLIKGNTKSCKCLQKELASNRASKNKGKLNPNYKHGATKTKEYNIWAAIKQRCYNPNNRAYKNYGKRGIIMSDRWLNFKNFLEDVGLSPKGYHLHRKNNNGNYEPDNCIYISAKEHWGMARKNP